MRLRRAGGTSPLAALPIVIRAVQLAGLLALALVLVPGATAAGEVARGVVPPLAFGGTAILFAEAAFREGGRRPLILARCLLAVAFTAWTVLAAQAAAGVPDGWQVALMGGVASAAILAAAATELPRGGPRWLPSAGLGGAMVATGAAAVVVALMTAAAGTQGRPSGSGAVLVVLDGALLVALLGALAVVGPTTHPHLRWLTGGLAVLVAADVVALSTAGTAALLAVPAVTPSGAAQLLATCACTTAGIAASDDILGRRADRRETLGLRSPLTLTDLLVAACFVLVAAAVLGTDISPAAAALALATLGIALVRTTAALRLSLQLDRTEPVHRTDDLTGLANRRALSEALAGDRPSHDDTGWSGWAGWADEIALLLVDLDRFKDINEALGHEAGDRLLAAVGARLRTALRPTQMLARLGGDEFAVVLPAAGPDQARRVAEALRDSLGEAFDVDGARLHVQASVGIATAHPSRGEQTDLLRQADVAMYQAKATDSGIEVYDPARDRDGTARLRRIEELREALERGDLEVHLQPQVDLRTGEITGAEALARWRHPQDGVLLPDSFLPLAEQTGLMRPVAALVLDRALAACATWWMRGHQVPVSVNLAAEDLRDPALHGQVNQALRDFGLPPAALRVEITEQALLTDPASASAVLERWRTDGVRVAIDDFGTGYSSLSYLRELPVDEVKLDRAFSSDIQRGTTSTIVRHTVAMAHGLWARVVAEGIEDEATARILADLGCDVGQGLFFGAAMTTPAFLEMLERGPTTVGGAAKAG